MQNLGPLTSTFTPPASCSSLSYVQQWVEQSTTTWLHGALVESARQCYPPDLDSPPKSYYYSPGVCPAGYTVACSTTLVLEEPRQTVHTCCPTDYDFGCLRDVVPPPGFARNVNWNCRTRLQSTVVVDLINHEFGDGAAPTLATLSSGVINANHVEVRFAAGDFTTLGEETSTSEHTTEEGGARETSSKSTSEPTTASTPSTTGPGDEPSGDGAGPGDNEDIQGGRNDSQSNNDGLGTGAIVGIAVGAALGGLLIGSLLVWLLLRRWLHQRRLDGAGGPSPPAPAMTATEHWSPASKFPGLNQRASELAAPHGHTEMPTMSVPPEASHWQDHTNMPGMNAQHTSQPLGTMGVAMPQEMYTPEEHLRSPIGLPPGMDQDERSGR